LSQGRHYTKTDLTVEIFMGWFNVVHGAASGSAGILNQCAKLLTNGCSASIPITGAQLDTLLTPNPGPNRYQEPGEASLRDVFRLHAWVKGTPDNQVPADPTTIELALAFRKTIKRKQPYTPTVTDPINSPPTRRWWGLCIGCPPTANPSPDPYYPIIKARCSAFYQAMDNTIFEALVVLYCSGWVPNPRIEGDSLYLQMTGAAPFSPDPDLQNPLPALGPFPAYPPFSTYCPTIAGVRIIFV
jgi:hypothetical protein